MPTKIEWCMNPDGTRGEVWNPVTGCTKVSEGCAHCYAETIAKRFWGDRKFSDVQCHEDRLEIPLHWKKPRRIFVNSMSDLFHPDVPFDFILRVWISMAMAKDHTFMILTKRPDRMNLFVNDWLPGTWGLVTETFKLLDKPFKNIWLGVTAENQKAADKRIPLLLQTPAVVRFVSCEPLLSSINVLQYIRGIDWVIVGGESGTNARPMHIDWARSLRDQCQDAGVPFFFKQFGEWAPAVFRMDYPTCKSFVFPDGALAMRTGKKVAGRLLDGREWINMPR